MSDYMRKILDLIGRTGDRCIVVHPETEDAYVVMAIEDYEMLADAASDLEWDDEAEGEEDYDEEWEFGDDVEDQVVDEVKENGNNALEEWRKQMQALAAQDTDSEEPFEIALSSVRQDDEIKGEIKIEEIPQAEAEKVEGKDDDRFYIEPVE